MNFLNVGMWFCFGRFDFIICDFGCVFFFGKAVPFLTKLVTLFVSEGKIGTCRTLIWSCSGFI